MAVLVTSEIPPFSGDGLGRGSSLGVGFLRKVNIDFNTSATTASLSPSDVGATKFYGVISIGPRSAHTFHTSTDTESSIVITASSNAGVADVYVLCAGI